MKKYIIELSEEQMILVSNCIEDISRFASGQVELRYVMEELLKNLPREEYLRRRDEVDGLTSKLKRVLFPNYHTNESGGYNSSEFIGNTYQIYRTILYQLSKDNNLNNVYSSPALPSGDLGNVKITKNESNI